MDDDYVECSNCGHQLEQHNLKGCTLDECTCEDRWTQAEIREQRKQAGLPATFRQSL